MRDAFDKALAEAGVRSRPRLMTEPGRSIAAPAGITLYRVGTVKAIPGVRTYVAVDGGMSDNLRPVTYGARYEAFLPERATAPRGRSTVTIAGKHCEQGDLLVRDAQLPADVAVGDILAMPVTGAYGNAMASNYNKVTRPAVVFVRDGAARLVVRRETDDDLVRLDTDDRERRMPWRFESSRREPDGADVIGSCATLGTMADGVGSGSSGAATSARRSCGCSTTNADLITRRSGVRIEVARVAVHNLAKERDVELAAGVLTNDAESVVADPDVDVIVEMIGGVEPARTSDPRRAEGGQARRHREQGAARQLRRGAVRSRGDRRRRPACSRRRSPAASRSCGRCASRSPASASAASWASSTARRTTSSPA